MKGLTHGHTARMVLLAAGLLASCHCGSSGFTRVSRTALADPTADLGRPFVGDVATATLAINSTGRGAVNVRRVTSTNDAFTLDWEGAPTGQVPPSGTLLVTITWRPTVVEQIAGTIEIDLETDDATQRHQIAQVTGESRELPNCDDGNSCTDDRFDRSSEQCRHTNTNNTCDDGNACTQDDLCQDGACRGVARSCDDQNVCTSNLCDPAVGCVFPPDGRICADEDPCTKDVCDPSGGCQHPNADDGTACGAFSCAIAHLCIFGACRELDVRGSSDGFPCSDGDTCTESDTCQAGACSPGPRREGGPEVVATLDTFGGEGAFVTTDGYRYLFIDSAAKADDPEGLRVTTWDGTSLKAAGSLQVLASAPPAMVAPGKFAVPHGQLLALVDATDVNAPSILWEVSLGATFPTPGAIATVAAVHTMTGGLLVLTRTAAEGMATYGDIYFIPLADPTIRPGRFVPIAQASYISEVDASEDTLVFATPDNVVWMRLESSGEIASTVVIPETATVKVSVEGIRVAVLTGRTLGVFEVNANARKPLPCTEGECADLNPGCDGTFSFPAGRYQQCGADQLCPSDSHCESIWAENAAADEDCGLACCDTHFNICFTPGPVPYGNVGQFQTRAANDILIHRGMLFRATDAGIWRDFLGPQRDPQPELLIDPMPTTGLEKGRDNLLLASGKVALGLQLTGGMGQRITGPGLGEITALVDQFDTKVLLGGPMAIGDVDVPAGKFSRWLTPTLATGPTQARMLNGGFHTAIVPPFSDGFSVDTASCFSTQVELVAAVDRIGSSSVCNLQSSSMATTPERIWAVAQSTTNAIGGTLVSWKLPATDAFPDINIPDGSNRESVGIRSSEDATNLGLLQYDYQYSTSRLYSVDVGARSVTGEYGLEAEATSQPPDANAFSVDGPVAISANWGAVRLHPRLPLGETPPVPAVALPFISLPDAHLSPSARVAAMGHGKAWIGWKQEREFSSQTVLTEVLYDAQGMTLKDAGSVDVRGMVNAVYDAGPYTVAATNSAVVILAPACGPVVGAHPPVH